MCVCMVVCVWVGVGVCACVGVGVCLDVRLTMRDLENFKMRQPRPNLGC